MMTCRKGWQYFTIDTFHIRSIIIVIVACATLTSTPLPSTANSQIAYIPNTDTTDSIETENQLENIRAFAKLYGYVRYFHPSDEASKIDWNRFAIYGVQNVKDADSQLDLKDKLADLFQPIAPTAQIYSVDTDPPQPAAILTPDDTTGLRLVSWQHEGFGFGEYDYYKSIRLNRPPEDPVDPLFEEHPEAGEVVEKKLGRGLAAQIPLALFSTDGRTLRPGNASSANVLVEKLQSIPIDTLTGANEVLRYADVVIAWNVFQHFYPYFDVVDVNWEEVLSQTLLKSSKDRTSQDFLKSLKWMVAQLKDGHGIVRLQDISNFVRFPFIIREIEGELMITAVSTSVGENVCFKQGDIITSINNEPVKQWLQKEKELISGTPQWKTALALSELYSGLPGEQYKFILSRPGKTVTCKVTHKKDVKFHIERSGPIEEIETGIYYVDLREASMEAIEKKADILAGAKGIIFDQRGYPNMNHGVLQYLSKDSLRSARWMVPQIIYPDRLNMAGYDTSGRWVLEPKEPFFSGKKVFLISKNTISYGESVMGIVEHYNLAEIVGERSAGANGTVSSFTLPGNYNISWTGMRVIKHDYSQHHLIGIKPTVPVKRTVEGVREGRDEYIEKALELIEESTERK